MLKSSKLSVGANHTDEFLKYAYKISWWTVTFIGYLKLGLFRK
jgi:hypothetical protein